MPHSHLYVPAPTSASINPSVSPTYGGPGRFLPLCWRYRLHAVDGGSHILGYEAWLRRYDDIPERYCRFCVCRPLMDTGSDGFERYVEIAPLLPPNKSRILKHIRIQAGLQAVLQAVIIATNRITHNLSQAGRQKRMSRPWTPGLCLKTSRHKQLPASRSHCPQSFDRDILFPAAYIPRHFTCSTPALSTANLSIPYIENFNNVAI